MEGYIHDNDVRPRPPGSFPRWSVPGLQGLPGRGDSVGE